jgi:hypothetical protein
MDKSIHLSDSQLEQILRAAAPLAPNDRSAFLADGVAALRGQTLVSLTDTRKMVRALMLEAAYADLVSPSASLRH